jgi:Uma2 family endonuclease
MVVKPVETSLLTIAEYLQLPELIDGKKHELVRGEVVLMTPPSFHHGVIQTAISATLYNYTLDKQLGRVTVESGVVTESDPDTVRGPDVAYWSYTRVPAGIIPRMWPDCSPDIACEVLSSGNRPNDMAKKIKEYLRCGVLRVWLVDPEEKTLTIFSASGREQTLQIEDTLSDGEVLPGFSCQVRRFFPA